MIVCTIHHVMGTILVCNIVFTHRCCSYMQPYVVICIETSDFEQGFCCSKLSSSFLVLFYMGVATHLGFIKFFIHNSLLQPSHLLHAHAVPKVSTLGQHEKSFILLFLGSHELDFGKRVSIIIHCTLGLCPYSPKNLFCMGGVGITLHVCPLLLPLTILCSLPVHRLSNTLQGGGHNYVRSCFFYCLQHAKAMSDYRHKLEMENSWE